jgi:hypothetical protein
VYNQQVSGWFSTGYSITYNYAQLKVIIPHFKNIDIHNLRGPKRNFKKKTCTVVIKK